MAQATSDLLDIHGGRGAQDFSDWKAKYPRLAAIGFKATEGATFIDPLCKPVRTKEILENEMLPYTYSFGYPDSGSDFKPECDFYFKISERAQIDWEISPPCLDAERNGPAPEGAWIEGWIARSIELSGRKDHVVKALLYLGRVSWDASVGRGWTPPKGVALWRPWYRSGTTWPPYKPFEQKLYVAWQNTDKWPGPQGGSYDHSWYRGTPKQFKELMAAHA